MKKSKVMLFGAMALTAGLALAACGSSQSSNADKTYSYIFVSNPDTLDYITSTRDSTSSITTNLIDGLLENDQYGNLIPSMAESWTVSKDGLTYTYKIRQGAKWYTSEGEEYADVTAHDFVTGLKYAADKKAENLYLVQDSIKGLADYVEDNHPILELLVLRQWMITLYNTLSTNLRLIGTLKQQQVFLVL